MGQPQAVDIELTRITILWFEEGREILEIRVANIYVSKKNIKNENAC